MRNRLLNGLAPAQFLRQHWQKKPLLVRDGLPTAANLVTRSELFDMAQSAETESRLIRRNGARWHVAHGPFRRRDFAGLPRRNWTLLVQGVNHVLPRAQRLLAPFSFIPYARLDDLMISYAPPGGGVGPHFDSYDVFLAQGEGSRRWQISSQRDLSLVDNAPLKILSNFRKTREWTLEAGDMLYLPPRCAHDGVALEPCITYSIGFRAPSAQELCGRFYDFVHDRLATDEHYADPQLRPTRQPARIGGQLAGGMLRLLRHAHWTREDMRYFIGEDLSTPKPHLVFSPPRRAVPRTAFSRLCAHQGLQLDAKSILLYDSQAFYMNGERQDLSRDTGAAVRRLANRRKLTPGPALPGSALDVLYEWYRAGYLHPGDGKP